MREFPRVTERGLTFCEWCRDPRMFGVARFEVEVAAKHRRCGPGGGREWRIRLVCIWAWCPGVPAGLYMKFPQCLHLSHPLLR